ncbi:hypothetical protein [Cytobacillus purgationiresistens]|uniref:Uncharacterized protein n=1 Tax=Cytobacillus purgationiresistens TaxID=863449 RepID=A0ABU0AFS2_9BACI|nr:hypothetical protein [Cytobacillus purgationiresistens]MDQ0270107.1 hypothetical protein [Cytobacillus purgationiresistens]
MRNELNFKSVEDMKKFIESELLTTREVADLLGCSRQIIKQKWECGGTASIRKQLK